MKITARLFSTISLAIFTTPLASAATLGDADRAQLAHLYRVQVAIGVPQAHMLANLRRDLEEYAPRYFKASQIPVLRDTGNTERNIAEVETAADFLLAHWSAQSTSASAMYEIAAQLAGDENQPELLPQSYLDTVAAPLGDPVSVLGFGYGIAPDRVNVEVRTVLPSGAAAAAGVALGDRLVAVGGVPVTTDLAQIGVALRASANPVVTFSRDGATHDVTLARTTIHAPTVFPTSVDNVAVARFTGIGAQTPADLAATLGSPPYANARGLILDLRATQSGTYDEAVAFLSLFVAEGTHLGTRQFSEVSKKLYATPGARLASLPIVLLVGQRTQGSVEFIAAALRKFSHAKLVGEYTRNMPYAVRRFQYDDGSGTLLPDGGLYLPGDPGASDDVDRALKPDVLLADRASAEGIASADPARDPQLAAALALLAH